MAILFTIVNCERLSGDRVRYVVETSDPSLFDLQSDLRMITEFLSIFRYRTKIALRIKEEVLYKKAVNERIEMLQVFESISGSTREKCHVILDELHASGKDWMQLGDVEVLLKIARSERKQSIKNGIEFEHKKSA